MYEGGVAWQEVVRPNLITHGSVLCVMLCLQQLTVEVDCRKEVSQSSSVSCANLGQKLHLCVSGFRPSLRCVVESSVPAPTYSRGVSYI